MKKRNGGLADLSRFGLLIRSDGAGIVVLREHEQVIQIQVRHQRADPPSRLVRPHTAVRIHHERLVPPAAGIKQMHRDVVLRGRAELLQIVAALHLTRRFPCLLYRRKQKPHQHPNNRNDDQKFYESKRSFFHYNPPEIYF